MRKCRFLSISILTAATALVPVHPVVATPVAGGATAATPAGVPAPPSGSTCWQKRAYYQARNPGLKETLGSGTRYSVPCVLASFVAIEQAAAEFGVTRWIDAMVRIAACESHLQPTMVGRSDRNDVGLFQWNDKPPHHWWTTIRKGFDAWQDRKAARSGGAYVARHSTPDRMDPYNAARVAAWVVLVHPRSWPVVWLCRGVYDPAAGRLR